MKRYLSVLRGEILVLSSLCHAGTSGVVDDVTHPPIFFTQALVDNLAHPGKVSCSDYDGQIGISFPHLPPSKHLTNEVVTVGKAVPGLATQWPSIDALIERPLEAESGIYVRSSDCPL